MHFNLYTNIGWIGVAWKQSIIIIYKLWSINLISLVKLNIIIELLHWKTSQHMLYDKKKNYIDIYNTFSL